MAEVKDLLINLLDAYKNERQLSKTRLTKLVYLCDWKYALEYGEQMTNIKWKFDNYGPFVWDVMNVIKSYSHVFRIEETTNIRGNDKTIIKLNDEIFESAKLTEREKRVLQFVIDSTQSMTFDDFIRMVYSTYPVVSSDRFEELNLVELAEEYENSPFYKNTKPEIEFIKIEEEEDSDF